MLNFNPSSLRTAPGDPVVHQAAGGASSNGSTDPAGFASLLRQTQAAPMPQPAPAPAPAPPAPPPPPAAKSPGDKGATTEPVSPKEAPDEAPAPQEPDSTGRARALQKGKLRAADAAGVSGRDGKPALTKADKADKIDTRDTAALGPTGTSPGGDCLAPETRLTAAATPIDPSVMQWLADLQRAAGRADVRQGGANVTGSADATDTADTAATESTGTARHARGADLKTDAALKDQAAHARASLTDPASAAGGLGTGAFAAALEEHGPVEKPPFKVSDNAKDVSALAAGAQATPTTGTDAAAPAAVVIATPVTAPDFAQELGLRLSVLAKDGVQTAELHLNPADMGPVSVQIVMDGTQARVDFGADMAATRQAIEAGLPELASALRDAGFTLAGGGVSQHAGGRGGNGNGDASGGDLPRRAVAADQVTRVATAARRIVTQGGVDLFA